MLFIRRGKNHGMSFIRGETNHGILFIRHEKKSRNTFTFYLIVNDAEMLLIYRKAYIFESENEHIIEKTNKTEKTKPM